MLNPDNERCADDGLEIACTVVDVANHIVDRHSSSSESRSKELRDALTKVITEHLRFCAIEHTAIAAQQAAHIEERAIRDAVRSGELKLDPKGRRHV